MVDALRPRFGLSILGLITVVAAQAAPPPIPDDPDLKAALAEYNKGHISSAVSLFIKELKEKPDNAAAHYYLGMALKKGGADATAVAELETAIKLVPDGMMHDMAMEALHEKFKVDEPAAPKPAGKPTWWSGITAGFNNGIASVTSMFSPPKPPPQPEPPKPAPPKITTIKTEDGSLKPVISVIPSAPGEPKVIKVTMGSEAEVIHMGELLRLAEESHKLDPSLQSHTDGVVRYPQAPEGSGDWDIWIRRFRATFDSMVLRHVAKNYKGETSGTASIIFSVDDQGNLRGAVYNATADDVLVNCLLDSVRELNKSYVLAFPQDTRCTGWNFRMRWNFGRALAYVKAVRQMKVDAIARARTAYEQKVAAAMLLKKKQEALAAKEKKLALDKAKAEAKAKMVVIKTGVAGMVLPKKLPPSLKAEQLKLGDMPKLDPNLSNEDIDDMTLQVNASSLFH